MKIKDLIKTLQDIQEVNGGEVECQLQVSRQDIKCLDEIAEDCNIVGFPFFFIVPELYDDGIYINIRTFPY